MLILITPPETEFEEQDLWVGSADTSLSQKGRESLAEFIQNGYWFEPDRIYLPPQQPFMDIASAIFCGKTHKKELMLLMMSELINRSMGSLQSRPYRETMEEFPRRNWLAWQRSFWTAPTDGESLFDISDRVLTAFRTTIMPIASTERVVIICAPDVMRIIVGFLTKAEEAEIPKIQVESMIPYVINGMIESP